jgi:hypothetical protein
MGTGWIVDFYDEDDVIGGEPDSGDIQHIGASNFAGEEENWVQILTWIGCENIESSPNEGAGGAHLTWLGASKHNCTGTE